MKWTLRPWFLAVAALLSADDASAFAHVVAQGDTLAQLAIRVYGSPRFETVIVGANALDAHGGSAIVAGQGIEIPAPSHHRVVDGETWPELARTFLGDARRAETIARANGGVSWVPPVADQEVEIPAVIAHIAAEGDTMSGLASRYLGDVNRAWELDGYNNRTGGPSLARGEIVLVPLLDLSLTEDGKRDARLSAERTETEGGGQAFVTQRRAETDIPPLLADVRAGRWVDAVAKGNRLLGSGDLTKVQLRAIHRALVETYVALDAEGLAAGACDAWRANGDVRLDPRLVSPKIIAACSTHR